MIHKPCTKYENKQHNTHTYNDNNNHIFKYNKLQYKYITL